MQNADKLSQHAQQKTLYKGLPEPRVVDKQWTSGNNRNNALPVANLLVFEYRWNLPVLLGIHKTGSLIKLHFISSNATCCSSPYKLPAFSG